MPSDVAHKNYLGFFSARLMESDPELSIDISEELKRQQNQIELIASENIVSQSVLEAQGSILTNKYAEGYPGKRYYGGCEFVDKVEQKAIDRARALFGCAYANVQPHSGSQANQAVLLALLNPGDMILGMSLSAGGHLTHGSKVNLSGKWFNTCHYGVSRVDDLIDYDEVQAIATEHQPKLIIAGGSAYPRLIDFARFRKIADSVGAYLMVDMAHFAGLVAGGAFPSPLPHAHVVTTTTHKTLRGPRGGMILSQDEEIGKKINAAIFPGLQGGPLMHVIAAKAVAFKEAAQPEFKLYAQQVIDNARAMAQRMRDHGFGVVSGGTDSHLFLVDLRSKNITGKDAVEALERVGLTCNKNGVPFDPLPPTITSGIRIGTPAGTTRGFGVSEFEQVADLIAEMLEALSTPETLASVEHRVRKQVLNLCDNFPIYKDLS